MRTIIITGVVLIGVMGAGWYYSQPVVFTNTEPTVVEKEVEVKVDALEKAIKDAQEAKRTEIEDTAQKAYDEAYNQEMKKVELQVLTDFNSKLDARKIELEKQTGAYWRDRRNIIRAVKTTAQEYGVDASTMLAIINCESTFEPSTQSHYTYTEKNVPSGFQVGDREQSFGLVQIHLPAHPQVSKEQALDPEFAIDFLARSLKSGDGWMWTCYNQVAMR